MKLFKKTHPFWHLVHNNVQKCYMSCISVTKCYNIIITWSIATGRGIVSENFSIPSSCLVISYFYSRESKFTNCLNPHLSNTVIFLSIGSLTKTTFPFPDIVSPEICGQLIIIQIKTDLKRQAKMCVPFAPMFKDLNSKI